MIRFPEWVTLSEAVANSYKDFHRKGAHYICLSRSPKLTMKLYLFDDVVAESLQVTLPHDCRYHFDLLVISGLLRMTWYHESLYRTEAQGYDDYVRFRWDTVLNKGGKGFSLDGDTQLSEVSSEVVEPGNVRALRPADIHTMQVGPGCALLIAQHPTAVRIPTRLFAHSPEPPSIDGLYGRYEAAEIIEHLRKFRDATGTQFKLRK